VSGIRASEGRSGQFETRIGAIRRVVHKWIRDTGGAGRIGVQSDNLGSDSCVGVDIEEGIAVDAARWITWNIEK
jgi:hypothetical protein